MKASIKTPTEISSMQEGGRKLSQTLDQLIKLTKPGVNLAEIEAEAQELIAKAGGEPGFAMVPGYDWATCVNLNEGIVHGIPDEKIIKAGDVASIDIGNFYQGFHTDMSRTFQVGGQKNKEIDNFLKTGKETLEKIDQVVS